MVTTAAAALRPRAAGAATLASLSILYWAAHTMLRPLVGPFVIGTGGTATQASVALASFAVLPTLFAVPLGSLADRFGDRRLLLVGSAGMIVGGGLLLPGSLGAVVAGQLVLGVGTLAVWVALQATATRSVQEESRAERDRRIATFSLFVAVGQLVGPFLGGAVAEAAGFRASFGVFMALSLAVLLLSLRRPAVPAHEGAAPRLGFGRGAVRSYADAWRLLRVRAVLVTVSASFLVLVVLDLRTAFHPIYLGGIGYSPLVVGALLSTGAAFAFLAKPLFGVLMRVLAPAVLVGLTLGIGAVSVGLVVLTDDLAVLLVLAAVNGFALGFAQPLTLALMAEHTPADRRGLAAGLRSAANRAAQLVDPVVFGLLLALLGIQGAFLTMTAMLLLATTVLVIAFATGRRSGH